LDKARPSLKAGGSKTKMIVTTVDHLLELHPLGSKCNLEFRRRELIGTRIAPVSDMITLYPRLDGTDDLSLISMGGLEHRRAARRKMAMPAA